MILNNVTFPLLILFSLLLIFGFARHHSVWGLALMWVGTLGMLGIIVINISRAISV